MTERSELKFLRRCPNLNDIGGIKSDNDNKSNDNKSMFTNVWMVLHSKYYEIYFIKIK